jgi:hypothetical protein
MPRYYEPDLTVDPNSLFVRDAANKLVRRGYWMDMNDRTVMMVMTKGIGANLTNDEKGKRAFEQKPNSGPRSESSSLRISTPRKL